MISDASAPWPSLRSLPGIGPRTAERLAEAGIASLPALLTHLPRDYRCACPKEALGAIDEPGFFTVVARFEELRCLRLKGGKTLVTANLVAEDGCLHARWWNRPYLRRQISEGLRYQISGEVRRRGQGLEMVNGAIEAVPDEPGGEDSEEGHGGHPVPVYSSLGPLGPARLRRLLKIVLESPLFGLEQDPVPLELRKKHGLPSWKEALQRLHRPRGEDSAESLQNASGPAHDRLSYGRALEQALARRQAQEIRHGRRKPHRPLEGGGDFASDLEARLPFILTAAQRTAWHEIREDLRQPWPMRRLLQGDVGAGKTVVAALAAEEVLAWGAQVAYLVPTELLAEQQWRTLRDWLGDRFPVTLRVSGTGCGSESGIGSGAASGSGPRSGELCVGTHALLEDGIQFRQLGLVIIDEQHRFGVEQRRRLVVKGRDPDLLVMTATPIPRSLALAHFGDLEVSCLREGPPLRGEVVTEVWPRRRRPQVWARMEEDLNAGGQALVIFPAIRATARGIPSLERERKALEKRFEPWGVAITHGGLSSEDRRRSLEAFRQKKVRVLLATTVVEVGVDLPEATWMIVEGAECYGLATLHQLRGRLARGPLDGCCIALHGPLSPLAEERLAAFAATTDGFHLAELDLELRGPGEKLSTRQSGFGTGVSGSGGGTHLWIERAENDAANLWGKWQDPSLQELRRLVEERCRLWQNIGEGA